MPTDIPGNLRVLSRLSMKESVRKPRHEIAGPDRKATPWKKRRLAGRLVLFVILILGVLPLSSGPAYAQTEPRWVDITPEGRLVAKKLQFEGGVIEVHGGLLVFPKILWRDKARLVLRFGNHSPNTVWVEFEVQDPVATKSNKQDKGLKSEYWFWQSYKLDELKWDTPYPVAISVFSDEKRTKSLGSFSTSFLFESGDRELVERAKKVAEEQFRHGEFVRVVLSGWPERLSAEEVAAAQKAKEERNPVPPFEWNVKEGFPGVTLAASEARRYSEKGVKLIDYDLKPGGFAANEELTLWTRWLDGKYMKIPTAVNEKGILQLRIKGERVRFDRYTVGKMAPGEPIAWALASETSGKRAYARAVPYPIEARGASGCLASAEMQTPTGLLFLVTLRGFSPGEDVEVTSEYGKEKKKDTLKADERGEIASLSLFGPGDHGKATVLVVGKTCKVSLTYKVGPDALVPQ